MREDTGQHLHPLLVSNSLTGLLSHLRRPGRHVEHVEGGLVLIELNVMSFSTSSTVVRRDGEMAGTERPASPGRTNLTAVSWVEELVTVSGGP